MLIKNISLVAMILLSSFWALGVSIHAGDNDTPFIIASLMVILGLIQLYRINSSKGRYIAITLFALLYLVPTTMTTVNIGMVDGFETIPWGYFLFQLGLIAMITYYGITRFSKSQDN